MSATTNPVREALNHLESGLVSGDERQAIDAAIPKLYTALDCLAASGQLVESLEALLRATVDSDLDHGIGLTAAEREARETAIEAIYHFQHLTGDKK